MHRRVHLPLLVGGVVLVAGCRTATQVTEVPRVDLELSSGGNRGYLVGTPPPATGQLKTTRQMVETTVEVPSFYKPKRTGAQESLEPSALSETETGMESMSAPTGGAPQHNDTYIAQKGDSLWSIAAKPEIYGKATYWRRIFDANRDILKSPNHLRAGMKLNIPRGSRRTSGAPSSGDEGTTFKK